MLNLVVFFSMNFTMMHGSTNIKPLLECYNIKLHFLRLQCRKQHNV